MKIFFKPRRADFLSEQRSQPRCLPWYNVSDMGILLKGQAEAAVEGITAAELRRQHLPQVQREATENVG
jgi:hypothetical protein